MSPIQPNPAYAFKLDPPPAPAESPALPNRSPALPGLLAVPGTAPKPKAELAPVRQAGRLPTAGLRIDTSHATAATEGGDSAPAMLTESPVDEDLPGHPAAATAADGQRLARVLNR